MVPIDPNTIFRLLGILAKVTTGVIDAVTMNETVRLPALRAHAAQVEAWVAAGTEPSQADIDAIADAIQTDIDFVAQRADEARKL